MVVHVCYLQKFVRNLKINDTVNSSLLKWIISHTYVIPYPISNDYIRVKFDDLIIGVKTEPHQKVLLQVSVRELHIDMLKIILLIFPWHAIIKELFL